MRGEQLQKRLRCAFSIDIQSSANQRWQERFAKASQPKGKLERDLAQQKKQTRTGTLENVSQDERRRRDADQASQAINYN
jgi:hypothetical protein